MFFIREVFEFLLFIEHFIVKFVIKSIVSVLLYITKKVFLWDKGLNDLGVINTWSSEVKDILDRNNLSHIYDRRIFPLKSNIKSLKTSLHYKDNINWQSSSRNLPKLRTFIQFKMFHSDSPHTYKPLSFIQRKQLSKFRLGMLHLRLETGRFVYPDCPLRNEYVRSVITERLRTKFTFFWYVTGMTKVGENFSAILLIWINSLH